MKINEVEGKIAQIELDCEELLTLNAALNEICNGIDVHEFETRIGTSRAVAEKLMAEIQMVLDQIPKS
ncbi:hypothetical protein LMG19282_02038 [Cupriavidus campinensis]|jgi:hypothetical protein|uniref:Uncharacterized protein n=1 Tax=Cupriavidus campinensis TaxID=151783 RepID=A0AAE9L0N0_9BURK|nr:hypothetical protein [Cupriavidus campinensis]TSP09247.1 hypothetical protein FGG12_28590 [Cupriavidus campinensis]URF02681.1 hypothetical protein M5D45_08835 [Cupriavidus campinensis]CAG2141417.1 hypothetical protein LMG19282_02038 [Cupriavidus campinensis]